MANRLRRKSPKIPAPPIDLEEIEQDPGFRGMLSFLEVSPEERRAELETSIDNPPEAIRPTGERPLVQQHETQSPVGDSLVTDSSLGKTPVGETPHSAYSSETPTGESLADISLMGHSPVDEQLMGSLPWRRSPLARVPYMNVEGRGKRPLRFCVTVQDGHTASEQLVYQALSEHARKYGRLEDSGSTLLDIGLAQLCTLLNTDHKNVKRLLSSLQEKLALEVVRQPDYRLAIPTRYRIFPSDQILARRRRAGLLWVVRTRTIRFVALETVHQLLKEEEAEPNQPVGQ